MSEPGPFGADGPFGGIPFLGELAKMLGGAGGAGWENARQLAVGIATGGTSEANVDPVERMRIEQLARVAELHVADLTGLPTSPGGGALSVLPVNRTRWVGDTLAAYRPLVERLAGSLGPPPDLTEALARAEPDPADPFGGMLEGLVGALQPMMVTMTAGSMVGHLARRCFGQYDLPIPRSGDELLLIVPNLDEFGQGWSLPPDDLRLWVCIHEIAHHAVLGVPHVRAALDELLAAYAASFRTDPEEIQRALGPVELSDPASMAGLGDLFRDPGALLGALRSPEQEAIQPRLGALVAVVVGVVDDVLDRVGGRLLADYAMLTEALRRRRVEASESDRFVERLLGLELTQATYDRGTRFVEGVRERAGDEGLRRLWSGPEALPTPNEVDAPGLWLARLDLLA
ncbi:MAG: zinc-dependent metalloprotease [Acidimicrobiia bacterium]